MLTGYYGYITSRCWRWRRKHAGGLLHRATSMNACEIRRIHQTREHISLRDARWTWRLVRIFRARVPSDSVTLCVMGTGHARNYFLFFPSPRRSLSDFLFYLLDFSSLDIKILQNGNTCSAICTITGVATLTC